MEQSKRKKTKRKTLSRVMIVLLAIGFIFLTYGGYIGYQTYVASKDTYEELDRNSKYRDEAVTIGEEPISILLMGIEDYSTGGKNGRTDSLILLTLDPDDKTASMLSIPRDSRVKVPGREGLTKINHAHAFGGTELTVETVEEFLKIPVDYYMKVNFFGFKKVVDELDGITVDVPFDFSETSDIGDKRRIYFEEGPMELDGEEALAYVRMRKQDPLQDLGRNERQKQVVKAAVEELQSPSGVLKLDNVIKHLGKNIKTNLKASDILYLSEQYEGFDKEDITSLKFDGKTEKINGSDFYIPSEESLKEIQDQLNKHLFK
ncbi:LCP family protein [Pseudalkalibacillus sp. Hm43]|uniref:LCP family protein n=1 Tax=Pseudalkalibacillus sp. Hm43 TaxID=3450742 RepID=UPI003F42725F